MRCSRLPQKAIRIALLSSIALAVAIAQGQVMVRVPHDFPTIEEAVAAAPPGATIQIAEGTYRVQLVIEKDLTLEGLSNAVTLRASNVTEPIVRAQGAAKVTLRNLIFDNGTRGLIVREDASVSLENSQVRDATLTGVLVQDQGQFICLNSKILENHGRAGITAQDQSRLILDKCTVRANDIEGVFAMGQTRVEIRQSLFERNRGTALVLSDDARAQVIATRFTSNGGGVYLEGQARLSIQESQFFSNADQEWSPGILVKGSAHVEVMRVRFLSEKLGIALGGQATASVRECEFVGDESISITSDGALITIESNIFRRGKRGIAIASQGVQTKILVRHNAFEDLATFLGDSYALKIGIDSKATVVVEGNTFERNLVAVAMEYAQNASIRDNTFFDNYVALQIKGSQAVVESNTLERNWIGIDISGRGGDIALQKNLLKESEIAAMRVADTAKVTIANNQIIGSRGLGIALLEEAHAALHSNVLSGGKLHGVIVSGLAQALLHRNRISEFPGCALYVGPKAKITRDEDNHLHNNQGGGRCGRVGDSWQERIERASPGAVLEIPPGVYYESLWINKPIEIRSSGAIFRGNTLDPVIVVTGNATARLEGVTLQDGIAGIVATHEPPYGNWFPGLIAEPGQQQLELHTVKIIANNLGIWADSHVTQLTIKGSELRDNRQYGIRFHGSLLTLAESTIAGHETGLFADLRRYQQIPGSITITQTNFANNQLGIDVRGLGQLTVESSQISGGAVGIWVHGAERGIPSEQELRVHIARSLIRDHRRERVTSFTLALLAIFSGEFVGSGLALEGQAVVTLVENEIGESEFHGIAVGQQSSVVLERNKIIKNGRYGVALEIAACMKGLAVPQRFEGRIEGKHNAVPGPGEPDANIQGAFCPKELEFLKTDQGGSYP